MRALLCILALLAHGCAGSMYAISNNEYPYVTLVDHSVSVQWHRKSLSLSMAQMQAIRVNNRGVHFIPAGTFQLALDGGSWMSAPCTRTRRGLCGVVLPAAQTRESGASPSIIFPVQGFSVVSSPLPGDLRTEDDGEALLWNVPQCPESTTRRTTPLRVEGTAPARYDVSLCNIIGGGGDIVFLPGAEMVYSRNSPVGFQVYVVIAVLTVYLSVILAHNLEVTLGTQSTVNSVWLTQIAIVALVLTLLFAEGSTDVLGSFVSVEVGPSPVRTPALSQCPPELTPACRAQDTLAFMFIVLYTAYYSSRAVCCSWTDRGVQPGRVNPANPANPVNPILAVLALAAMRVHMTMDNTYSVVISILVVARLINKISCAHCIASWAAVDTLMDATLVSVMIYTGVVPQNGGDPILVALYTLQGAAACLFINHVMIRFERHAEAQPPHVGKADKGM